MIFSRQKKIPYWIITTVFLIILCLTGTLFLYLSRTEFSFVSTLKINRNVNQQRENVNSVPALLSAKKIRYAEKSGKKVLVLEEDLETKRKEEILTYQEVLELNFNSNYWSVLPPSISLSSDRKNLAYVSEEGLIIYNLDSKISEIKLFKTYEPALTEIEITPPSWSYQELPDRNIWGFYNIFLPLWSPNNEYLSLAMAHYEGSSNGIYNISDNTLDILRGENAEKGAIGRDRIKWANHSNRIIVGADSNWGYSSNGLFLGEEGKYHQAQNLASIMGMEESGQFYHSDWAADDSKIALVVGESLPPTYDFPNSYSLAVINPDGSEFKKLITHPNKDFYPLFYGNQELYYYLDSVNDLEDGLWKIKIDGSENSLIINDRASVIKPLKWFSDRYLVYLLMPQDSPNQENYSNQIGIYDRGEGKVIYLTEKIRGPLTFLDLIIE